MIIAILVTQIFLNGCRSVRTLDTPGIDSYQSDVKWNVIFILVDDLGWTDLGSYGSDFHETPHIDKFVSESLKFTQAYAAGATCSPTRASLMTGKYPARLNYTTWMENAGIPKSNDHRKLLDAVTISNLPLTEYTIAKALNDDGYFTAHVGKWHLGDVVHYPEAHGFDFSVGSTAWGAPYSYMYPFKGWRTPTEYRFISGLENIETQDVSTYLTDRLTDEAVKVIHAKKDEPFFLLMAYYNPHTPIEGKPEYVEYFNDKDHKGIYHNNPGYAAMIASLDENVGRLLAEVKKAGIGDNTVIIFYSDDGGALAANQNNNYPLRLGKGTLYEGGIRVPLIVKWPGVTSPGSISNVPVSTMDFYPTLLEIAGIEGNTDHNKYVDGLSLVPIFKNPAGQLERNELFWHFPHYYFRPAGTAPHSALRKDNWKLIHHYESDQLELYNLDIDLSETNNLIHDLPDKALSMYQILKSWRNAINAQNPTFNPDYMPESW